MKNYLKNASVNVFLLSLPSIMVMACAHILAAVVILATLLTVEVLVIKDQEVCWGRKMTRAKGMYSFLGIAIALSVLALNTPPQLAIIIALCLLLVGTVQISIEEAFSNKKMLWLKLWEDWASEESNLSIAEYLLFLMVALFSIVMVVANFDSQTIWLPLIACGLIVYVCVQANLFSFSADDVSVKIIGGFILAVIGIVSTLIQFDQAKVFGILIWVIGLAIGIILVLAIIALHIRDVVRKKRREKMEKKAEEERRVAERKQKEMLQQSLLERISDLTWEEIWSGFNKINESFGIQLFLSSPKLGKLQELVTVSNEKKQIFWHNDLSRMLQIMEKASRKIEDDDNLKKMIKACIQIQGSMVAKKSTQEITYKGEAEFRAKLENICETIHPTNE